MLGELADRACAYVNRYPPYYISSIGCHLLNLANKDRKFYYHSGSLFDFRTHPFMIAPPGFSKSFWLNHFLDEDSGLLRDGPIKHAFEGYMTEAGWVGQAVRGPEGKPEIQYGAAFEYKKSIVGIEEFSAIVEAMKTSHSKQLDTAMLTSLDKGRVRKRVGPGSLPYDTGVTLWAGTQTMRLELTSGIGRRLVMLPFYPTEDDKKRLREIYLKGHNVRYNPYKVRDINLGLEQKMKMMDKVTAIEFDDTTKEFFKHKKVIHYEIPLYERIIAGYVVMSQDFDNLINVKMDVESLRLVNQEIYWREQIKRGGRIAQVLMLLKEYNDCLHINELRDKMVDLAFDWQQSSELIAEMMKNRIITVDSKGNVTLWRKKVT